MEHKEIIKEEEKKYMANKYNSDNKEEILEQKIKEQEDLIDNLDSRINALSGEIKKNYNKETKKELKKF